MVSSPPPQLTSMELVFTPNCSLLYLQTDGTNSLKKVDSGQKVAVINISFPSLQCSHSKDIHSRVLSFYKAKEFRQVPVSIHKDLCGFLHHIGFQKQREEIVHDDSCYHQPILGPSQERKSKNLLRRQVPHHLLCHHRNQAMLKY